MSAGRSLLKTLTTPLMRRNPELALRVHPPRSLSIEVSSVCNIDCLCCPVGQGAIEKGLMDPGDFRKIVDLLPSHVKQLDFSHRGDPTTHSRLAEMVGYAHGRGLRTDVYTNGLVLDRHVEGLVEAGVTTVRIDLDGARKESYESYRIGSDFERVRANIRALVEARRSSGGRFPENIYIICVLSAFNENEVSSIQAIAEELGADAVLFKSAIPNYGSSYYNDPGVQDDIVPKNEAYWRQRRDDSFLCPFLWRGCILHDGGFIMCTADFEAKYLVGNVLEEGSFEKVFYGEPARAMRRKIVAGSERQCRECAVVAENHYLPEISRKFR